MVSLHLLWPVRQHSSRFQWPLWPVGWQCRSLPAVLLCTGNCISCVTQQNADFLYGFALLKMGTMVPETCWVNGLLINHNCCIKLVSQILSECRRFYLYPPTGMYICSQYCDEAKLLPCAVIAHLDTVVLRPSMNHISFPLSGVWTSLSGW